MPPRVKYGLIAGLVGLVLNTCMTIVAGWCGPFAAILTGAVAGFLAAQAEQAASKGSGARVGAVAGFIAGALVLLGQLVSGFAASFFLAYFGVSELLGTASSPPAEISQQFPYYLRVLGLALLIGSINLVAGAAAGAAAGYFGASGQAPEASGG